MEILKGIMTIAAWFAANPEITAAIVGFIGFVGSEILGVIGQKGWFPLLMKALPRIARRAFTLFDSFRKSSGR